MEIKSLKASTKEDELFGVKATDLVSVDVVKRDINPKYFYCIVPVKGDCMDSVKSPIRIKDGDYIMIHQIPLTEGEIISNVKKIVCFIMEDGRFFVKQLVFWDGLSWGIRVKMFLPQETIFFVPLDKIKALFVVDHVVSSEYIEAHCIPKGMTND